MIDRCNAQLPALDGYQSLDKVTGLCFLAAGHYPKTKHTARVIAEWDEEPEGDQP